MIKVHKTCITHLVPICYEVCGHNDGFQFTLESSPFLSFVRMRGSDRPTYVLDIHKTMLLLQRVMTISIRTLIGAMELALTNIYKH